jgi:hypothetical protein
MRCLYCGNRISLLRKFKDSEFCSLEHRDLYQQEQTELALARLTEAGNRIAQPRRPLEPLALIEEKPAPASTAEDLNLPEACRFIPELPSACHPQQRKPDSLNFEWSSAQATPPLFDAPGATFTWEPIGYCRPALAPSRTGPQGAQVVGGVSAAEFRPVNLQLQAPAIALDLGEQTSPEVEECYAVAPPLPLPMPRPVHPEEAAPGSPVALVFETLPPELESSLDLSPPEPNLAGRVVMQPRAVPPCSECKAPRMWPAVPRVSVRTMMDGPFQRAGAIEILTAPAWGSQVPPLASCLPLPLLACPSDARAPEMSYAVTGAPLRLLPASALLAGAGLRMASCRLQKPGAALGTTNVLATSVTFAPSQLAPVQTPGFLASTAAWSAPSGGPVSIPLVAAEFPVLSTEAAEEIPMAVSRRLPEFTWFAARPRLRTDAGLSGCKVTTHFLPPRPMAGGDLVTPMASRGQGGRKAAARTVFPTANLPLPAARLGYNESLMPLATAPLAPATAPTGAASIPNVNVFIPCRRRSEIKARIALFSMAEFVRCRGMASSEKLQRLDANLASMEDPRMAVNGAARFMGWTSFPPPAMSSPEEILARRPVDVAPPSVPPQTRLFSISLSNLTTIVPPVKPVGASAPHTICRPPRLPSFGTTQNTGEAHERTSALLSAMIERLEGGPTRWALTRLWRRVPVPVKGLVAGILLLGAVAAMGTKPSGDTLSGLREEIRSRAAVELVDDFRTGMGAWNGGESWAETWSYDKAGFVQPGRLALYRPSMTLNDYRFEFLGQIGNRGLGWVFRAVDTENYYAMKIVFTKPGPIPAAALVRYAVIDGIAGPKTQLPLPMGARTDMMYRIRMDVEGSNFTAQFQNQIVDDWSDKRLAAGGVGFFSDKGEQAKIRWIEVSHQSDFLGKLCAYLVPFDARSTNRSLTR